MGETLDAGDEAMSAVLRDRINSLLTANADLEREVARLRYAEAARGAAKSQETMEQLRNTKDKLNSIVDENINLKLQIGKTRYGKQQNFGASQNSNPSQDDPSVVDQQLDTTTVEQQ